MKITKVVQGLDVFLVKGSYSDPFPWLHRDVLSSGVQEGFAAAIIGTEPAKPLEKDEGLTPETVNSEEI